MSSKQPMALAPSVLPGNNLRVCFLESFFRDPVSKIFICHSTRYRELVEREIVNLLQRHGISTWFSKDDIRTAEEWERSILRGLNECDWFLVAMSRSALESQWVRSEVHWAIESRWGRIVPVLLEPIKPVALHLRLSQLQYVDFTEDLETAGKKLLGVWGTAFSPLPKTRIATESGHQTDTVQRQYSAERFSQYHELRSRVAELPGYSLQRTTGTGSVGTVFLAHSDWLGGAVAIKMIDLLEPEMQSAHIGHCTSGKG
jgi:hypothetical protein